MSSSPSSSFTTSEVAIAVAKDALLACFTSEQNPKGLDFRKAYAWKKDDIIKWLRSAAEDPKNWGHEDGTISDQLRVLFQAIEGLSSPDGKLFQGPTDDYRPWQHISREPTRGWEALDSKDRELASKFIVTEFVIELPFFGLYDMLGLFLGLLGKAPPHQANKFNFWLPLTAMYAQWCSELGSTLRGDHVGGAGDTPTMFQCTWNKVTGKFRLGSSSAGYSFEGNQGAWRDHLNQKRLEVLRKGVGLDFLKLKTEIGDAPWGNCAETYPFVAMFVGTQAKNQDEVAGLALDARFLVEDSAAKEALARYVYKWYDDSRGGVYLRQAGPCGNCRFLIDFFYGRKTKDWLSERNVAHPEKDSKEDSPGYASFATRQGVADFPPAGETLSYNLRKARDIFENGPASEKEAANELLKKLEAEKARMEAKSAEARRYWAAAGKDGKKKGKGGKGGKEKDGGGTGTGDSGSGEKGKDNGSGGTGNIGSGEKEKDGKAEEGTGDQ